MTPQQINLVQETFADVKPIAATAAELFYNRLFTLDPALRPLFKGEMGQQGQIVGGNAAAVVVRDRVTALGALAGAEATRTIEADGLLTISVSKAASYGCVRDVTTYALLEEAPHHPGTRFFSLLKVYAAVQDEPYAVQVGGVDTCRCKAGRCKVADCKHRSAVEAVIAEGGLEETAYRRRLVAGVASVRRGGVAGCVKGVLA